MLGTSAPSHTRTKKNPKLMHSAFYTGGAECEIESVTPTSLTCFTPPHAEGDADVTVTSNSVAYDPETFSYSAAATPSMGSISPGAGLAGGALNIAGKYSTNVCVFRFPDSSWNHMVMWIGHWTRDQVICSLMSIVGHAQKHWANFSLHTRHCAKKLLSTR